MEKKASIILSCLCAAAASLSCAPSGDTVRIGTYNLRVTVDKGDNAWASRKHRLVKSVRDNGFDIFGVQEASLDTQAELPALLDSAGMEYGCWFFSPYSQDGRGGKAQGIFYRRDRFRLSGKHFFWLSETPDSSTVNDTGANGRFRRGGCCATVEDLEHPGRRFFFMVSHGPLNPAPNSRSAEIYNEMERRYNTEGLPSVFVGDLNAPPSARASSVLRETWTDSYMCLPDGSKSGPEGTFNGFRMPLPDSTRRIDYVYFKGSGIRPVKYVCDGSLYDGCYASDHFPVYVEMEIK